MLAAPDGGTLVYGQTLFEPTAAGLPRLHVLRITPAGSPAAATGLEPGFGGGLASGRTRTTGTLEQNGFRGALLARPDGSYLAVGGLSVVKYTGEGEGSSAGFAAIAAYSPLLAPDASYGGPQQAARATVGLPRQRARSDYDLRRVLARVTTNGPGLVLVRIRDGRRRMLAQVVAAAYAAGTTTVRIPLTKTGRSVLRRGRSLRVIAGVDFRDVLTGPARGTRTPPGCAEPVRGRRPRRRPAPPAGPTARARRPARATRRSARTAPAPRPPRRARPGRRRCARGRVALRKPRSPAGMTS